MKIAFVQPPNMQRSGDWKKMRVSRPPINLALLANYIRKSGHNPIIFDFDWYEGGAEEMARLILLQKPQVVGFTCLTPRMAIALDIAAKIKAMKPEIKIVAGGAHINAVKEKSLYTNDIDYAIYGESEEALAELFKAIEEERDVSKIQNLIYRRNGRISVNPARPFIQNLDELPLPAWDLLNLEDYKDPAVFNGIHMGVMTSRGCLWNCIFCSSGVVWGNKVRFRSAENVIDELDIIANKLNIHNVMFYDDTFTLNRSRFIKITNAMAQRKLGIRYYCQLRVDTIDEMVADALARSGCIAAAIGVESGEEEILKILKKGIKKDQVRKAVCALKASNVPIVASYIIGSPHDSHKSIKMTFEFAKELDTDQAKFMICTPFPGTELFDMAVEKGLLPGDVSAEESAKITYYQHVAANLSDVSDEDLLNYQRQAYGMFKQRPLAPSPKFMDK